MKTLINAALVKVVWAMRLLILFVIVTYSCAEDDKIPLPVKPEISLLSSLATLLLTTRKIRHWIVLQVTSQILFQAILHLIHVLAIR